jgi:hypothetical protein
MEALRLAPYKADEAGQFAFYRMPKVLFTDPKYRELSDSAKILYGLMLDRMSLSVSHNWLDEDGNVFIRYSYASITKDLNCGTEKASRLLNELEEIGLIVRRSAAGKASIFYVMNFMKETPSGTEEVLPPEPTPSEIEEEESAPETTSESEEVVNGRNIDLTLEERKTTPVPGLLRDRSTFPTSSINEVADPDLFGNRKGTPSEIEEPPLRKPKTNKTEVNKTDLSKNLIYPSLVSSQSRQMDGSNADTDSVNRRALQYRQLIRDNLDYDIMMSDRHWADRDLYDQIFELMCDVVCVPAATVRIAGRDVPYELVKSRFLKLHSGHVQYVIDCLQKNTTKISNIRAYLLTALYNAPTTMDSYYRAEVNHDMWG